MALQSRKSGYMQLTETKVYL